MENKKIQVIAILLSFIAMLFLLYYVFTFSPEETEFDDDLLALKEKHSAHEEKSEKEIESFNQTMNEQHERRKLIKEKYPDELSKYERVIAERFVELAKTQIRDIKLWGRVVDQYGEPVADAAIKYSGGGYVYATGSPPEMTKTDANGNFAIVAQGRTLHINKPVKTGYQFHLPPVFNLNRKPSWTDYTDTNPYVIKAWKVDRYPKVSQEEKKFRFDRDNQYTIDLLSEDSLIEDSSIDGDFKILFNVEEDYWKLTILAVNGGLQETKDQYRYSAPDNGYVNQLIFEGKGDPPSARHIKKIYFNSRNDGYYGTINMEIWPYRRNNTSTIYMNYVVNLEQGRNLTVKPMRSSIPDQ